MNTKFDLSVGRLYSRIHRNGWDSIHKSGSVQVRTALETVTALPEFMFVIVLDSSTIAITIYRLPEICSLDFSDSFGLAAHNIWAVSMCFVRPDLRHNCIQVIQIC